MQTRDVFKTPGLTASKNPGLIMSVWRPAGIDSKPAVSGQLSETDLTSVGSYATVPPICIADCNVNACI